MVNNKKTSILCISDTMSYRAGSFIVNSDGERIFWSQKRKILGSHFDSRPTCHALVQAQVLRMREKAMDVETPGWGVGEKRLQPA